MANTNFSTLVRLAPALALLSCAAPKAIVVEEVEVPAQPPAPEAVVIEDLPPPLPDGGFRMPDLLAMPGDEEFRATSPAFPSSQPGSGAVIARPPTEPPSRPKPVDPVNPGEPDEP
jgi:hypothetical protein